MRPSIEYFGNASVALLTGSIPNLQLQYFVFYFDEIASKLYTYRNVMLIYEVIVN